MVSAVMQWKNSSKDASKLWKSIQDTNDSIKGVFATLLQQEEEEEVRDKIKALSNHTHEAWEREGGRVGKQLCVLRHLFVQCRALLKSMGDEAGVPIEPNQQSALCDATMQLPGVLAAGVPGAGGFDAIFAIVMSDAARRRVEDMWLDWKDGGEEMKVVPMIVHEDSRGVRRLPSNRQVVVLATGGTMDKAYPRAIGGYAFEIGDPAANRVLDHVAGVDPCVLSVLRKDSTDITASDRQRLLECVVRCGARHIVITHGTDTMIQTAQYLHDVCVRHSLVVVLTGSKIPETFKGSDADFNLGFAMGCCQCLSQPGAYIAMSAAIIPCHRAARDETTGAFIMK